jgi:hypothetical protein
MNRTLASISIHTSLLLPKARHLRKQIMIPTFITDKLDVIPHPEGNNDGDSCQEYSQWQRWARRSSNRSRQRRHVDPRLIKSSDDLLSEYVDPQAERHMSFPELGSFVPTKIKSAQVQAAKKAIPVNSHLYPNPDSIHDHDNEVDVCSLFSSHYPCSSTASTSLATTILTAEGEEKSQEMHDSLHSLQFSEDSSRYHQDDCHDHNMSAVSRTPTTGPGRMTMNDSSLDHQATILRAASSMIRQQEAIMRDIEERQIAELRVQEQREQQQQRRKQQQRETLSSTVTVQSAIAVDAGFLTETLETTSTDPVQDPSYSFIMLAFEQAVPVAVATTNTNSSSSSKSKSNSNSTSTSRQVAASSDEPKGIM